jgi:hypothetical protein
MTDDQSPITNYPSPMPHPSASLRPARAHPSASLRPAQAHAPCPMPHAPCPMPHALFGQLPIANYKQTFHVFFIPLPKTVRQSPKPLKIWKLKPASISH